MRFVVVLLLASFAVPALAQDLTPMLDRLERLERDTQNLQLQVFRGEGKTPDNLGELQSAGLNRIEARLATVEQGLRQLTGGIEELQYQLQQQQQRYDKSLSDAEIRLQQLEQRVQQLTQAQTQTTAPTPPPETSLAESDPAPDSLPADPKTVYDSALNHIRQGEFAAAESALRGFLQSFPQDALAGNAQYWLGETLYVRKMFEPASVEFLASYKNYPKSPKAPDSLLKLGLSLANLQKTAQACASFAQLHKQFPKAEAALIARAKAEQKKLACG